MLTNQNQLTSEQAVEYAMNNACLASSSANTWSGTECAWCLSEQGLEFGNGSHGICARHATQVLKHYHEVRTRRRHAATTKESCCA
jgi:hypothetical protein